MQLNSSLAFPVLGIAAWSGTGKTTLLEQLLPRLRAEGIKVAVIKHAHHRFDVDQPGKDSYKLRSAGATPILVASNQRLALMQETPGGEEPDLNQLLAMMAVHSPDLVLVEGFKAWPLAKLVLYRNGIGDADILLGPGVEAVALDGPSPVALPAARRQLALNDTDAIASWIIEWMAGQRLNDVSRTDR
ncbi:MULTISPECIES: molybdopterin-guanine dinucleotide biosynthesis protein B [unclassified Halomonas]|uniref:molybdopterin-guanine dinucleotide biosynthesis protein B n=1 Tax=unclassified Halomonas TaxID=2609666 RepID=UPI0006D9766C|nr:MULTISPECIES: molybdopterin-guanine dinucleotide biosynthesis protein B [unclassified Halomonas]KPQ22034.1 MAG: molybdopterin-guanine dinucleotide biosynthesis protein MobB [Halomonas sp. HL-93]SBR48497.1 molybdopterin-guanine dinucleotide biosynthesis protein B [Halomonas sp. HL-93]SNY96255.1 molybdopterin-guanine dinucleotide biosynthesis protein B [Halomonas sp. hl-4]